MSELWLFVKDRIPCCWALVHTRCVLVYSKRPEGLVLVFLGMSSIGAVGIKLVPLSQMRKVCVETTYSLARAQQLPSRPYMQWCDQFQAKALRPALWDQHIMNRNPAAAFPMSTPRTRCRTLPSRPATKVLACLQYMHKLQKAISVTLAQRLDWRLRTRPCGGDLAVPHLVARRNQDRLYCDARC